MSKSEKIPSRVNRKGGNRGCLCKDGRTYSRKCCDGSLHAQGIGNIYGTIPSGVTFVSKYRIQNCVDGHEHNAHIHDKNLNIGSVYYMELSNNHNSCYTVLREIGGEGIQINTATLSSDCATCINDNL